MVKLKSTVAMIAVLFTCLTAASDDKAPALRTFEGWGTMVDPDGDCKAELDGKSLVVEAPAKAHDLSVELERMNAPRVVQDVSGDFIVQVTVAADLQPTGPSTILLRTPYNGAGLLLYDDEDSYIRLERAAIERDGKVISYVNFEIRDNGQHDYRAAPINIEGDWHMRLERHGDKIQALISPDGYRWLPLAPFTMTAPKTSKVGVAVCSSSSIPFSASFTDLQLFKRSAAPKTEQTAAADGGEKN